MLHEVHVSGDNCHIRRPKTHPSHWMLRLFLEQSLQLISLRILWSTVSNASSYGIRFILSPGVV